MTLLPIPNPFNAHVYYEENVSSTQDVSRELAEKGEPHGTVICADFQENGRGRGLAHGQKRTWQSKRGESLLFTILLRYLRIEEIPKALALRTGLAVTQAIEKFEPSLKNKTLIKWPNDVLINEQLTINNEQCYKKAAGILCEADGGIVHVGIGINVLQKEFPSELQKKAASIALASGKNIESEKRFELLKIILVHLYNELESNEWKNKIEKNLYKKSEQITFIEGTADSENEIKGILTGISDNGEIIIDNQAYITGELKF